MNNALLQAYKEIGKDGAKSLNSLQVWNKKEIEIEPAGKLMYKAW